MTTEIEWVRNKDGSKGETWNPLTGCEYLSQGCRGCYAAREAYGRLSGNARYEGLAVMHEQSGLPRFTGHIRLQRDRLDQPLRWRKPRRVFVNSMSDLFHEDVPVSFIEEVFAVMGCASQHQFQVLTKRPGRMLEIVGAHRFVLRVLSAARRMGLEGTLPSRLTDGVVWPLANVWLGTSIELDRYTPRAETLSALPAAVRFLSLEPLLAPLPSLKLDGIGWVIVGGESGSKARPMHPSWVRDLRQRCAEAGVPFFLKQWGEWAPASRDEATHLLREYDGELVEIDSATMDAPYGGAGGEQDLIDRGHSGWARVHRPGKKRAGRSLDGRTWDEYPNQPEEAA